MGVSCIEPEPMGPFHGSDFLSSKSAKKRRPCRCGRDRGATCSAVYPQSAPAVSQNNIVKNNKTTEDYEDRIVKVICETVDGSLSLLPVL
jgi:hypothetical protein